jgi:hypothetical protein
MYSEVREARARVPEAMGAPKDLPGGGLPSIDRQTTRPGGYANWATVHYRPIGTSDVQRGTYFLRSAEPLTPEEVEARVRADFEAEAQDVHGSTFRMVLEGAAYTGYERLVPVK